MAGGVPRRRTAGRRPDCRPGARQRLCGLRRGARGLRRGPGRLEAGRGARPRGRLARPAARGHRPDARRGERSLGRAAGTDVRRHAPGLDRPRRRRGDVASAARWCWRCCTSPRRNATDSLAAMIAVDAAPSGSNLNPVSLDGLMHAPIGARRWLVKASLERSGQEGELMLALSAVITREGQHLRGRSGRRQGAARRCRSPASSTSMSAAASSRRDTGDDPIAVNLVWVVEHMTVKRHAGGCRAARAGLLPPLLPDFAPPPSRHCSSRRSRG